MKSRRGLVLIGIIAGGLTAALAPLMLLGLYVRPTSDDWCLIPLGRSDSFNGVVALIYQEWNGRLGNAAVLGMIYPTYDVSSKVLPAVMLAGFSLIFYGVWRGLLRYALQAPELTASVCGWALSVGTVLALLLSKPHAYQTLYQPAVIVSHTLPLLIAGVILLAVLFLHSRGNIWPAAIVAFSGGAVIGTFNEAFNAVGLVSVMACLGLRWLMPRHALHGVVIGAGGLGLLTGFVSVFFSPGSRNRQQLIHNSLFSTDLMQDTWREWLRAAGTTFGSGQGVLLLLLAAAVGVVLGASSRLESRRYPRRILVAAMGLPALWALAASLGATFVLAYSFNGELLDRERVWPSITVSLLLAGAWYVLILSRLAARRVMGAGAVAHRRTVAAGAVVSLAALALFGLILLDLVRDERALVTAGVVRSVAWDKQQTVLLRQVAAGAQSLVVRPLPIDMQYEPFYPMHPNYPQAEAVKTFPASCVPAFYGVQKVVRAPRSTP